MKRNWSILGAGLVLVIIAATWFWVNRQPAPIVSSDPPNPAPTQPPAPVGPTKEIIDNGQVRLFSNRGLVTAVTADLVKIRITTTRETDAGVFNDYLENELKVVPESTFFRAVSDTTAENGYKLVPISLNSVKGGDTVEVLSPGDSVEFYSPQDPNRGGSLVLKRLIIIF